MPQAKSLTSTQVLLLACAALIGTVETVSIAKKAVDRYNQRQKQQQLAYAQAVKEQNNAEIAKAEASWKAEAEARAEAERRDAQKKIAEAERQRKAAEAEVKQRASDKAVKRRGMLKGKFKKESVELAATVDLLDRQLKSVANDLDEYRRRISSIVIPSRVMVTNVYRYCMSAVATNITEKTLTVHERKVKAILQAFDDKELEKIYCRYVPGGTFKHLKSELVTDFRAVVESHEEFGRQRDQRRKAATGRINALNSASDSETRKLKAELEADRQTIADYKYTSTDSPLYSIRRHKAEALEKKYKVDSIWSAENIVISRLKALDDQKALSHKFKVADVVRHEANADVDAESEERFKLDKTACVQRYYDKISVDFIAMLEAKKADITEQMAAACKKASSITEMLDNWDLLDESRLDQMAQDTLTKIMDAVQMVSKND